MCGLSKIPAHISEVSSEFKVPLSNSLDHKAAHVEISETVPHLYKIKNLTRKRTTFQNEASSCHYKQQVLNFTVAYQ